jgi:hypothetical protein
MSSRTATHLNSWKDGTEHMGEGVGVEEEVEEVVGKHTDSPASRWQRKGRRKGVVETAEKNEE